MFISLLQFSDLVLARLGWARASAPSTPSAAAAGRAIPPKPGVLRERLAGHCPLMPAAAHSLGCACTNARPPMPASWPSTTSARTADLATLRHHILAELETELLRSKLWPLPNASGSSATTMICSAAPTQSRQLDRETMAIGDHYGDPSPACSWSPSPTSSPSASPVVG
jgi:hypothetical protein